jgi:oxygen-dependent protoporphyrinogen oxidase
MTDTRADSAATAGTVDVVVVGGGVAGLVVARQLAHLGHSVVVVEQRTTLGGFVAEHEVAGMRLDAGAESYATRKGTVAALVTELGLGDDIVVPAASGAWVAWQGGTAPLPSAGVLGIPGVPLADDVRRIIGWSGALRAYLDRLMPLLRVRKESDLGDIVRRRMGRRVLERLVTPVVAGVHSADPSMVDVHTVAPGLTQAMTTQGSLSGAVMALREQAPAGSQVQGIVGGMYRLIEALETDCEHYGVRILRSTRVTGVEDARGEKGGTGESGTGESGAGESGAGESGAGGSGGPRWRVRIASVDAPDDALPSTGGPTEPLPLAGRALVVATGFRAGLALLSAAGADRPRAGSVLPDREEWPSPASVTLATVVVDDARLDVAPRGTGVLVAPGTPGVRAKALTHATAKWAWLAESLPAHRHVLRLSYGRRDGSSGALVGSDPGSGVGEAPDLETVLSDASALLGVDLSNGSVRGFSLVRWDDSLAFATVGHKARVRQTLGVVNDIEGLDVVGAWVSGTGLAATVEHARSTGSGLAAELRGDRRIE